MGARPDPDRPPRSTLSVHRRAAGPERVPQASEIDGFGTRFVELVSGCTVSVDPELSADEWIAAILVAQNGRASRSQLMAAGVAASAIDRRVRAGRLSRHHSGVYGAGHAPDPPFAVETAALLACGEGSMLCDHSGATLWQLRPGEARPVHVLVPPGRRGAKLQGVVVHRSTLIRDEDRRIHRGLRVTSPAWTLLDAAARLPADEVERLLAEAIFVRRIVTRQEVERLLERTGRHPGRARLAAVLAAWARPARTDSDGERRLLALIRAAELPEPETQVTVLGYVLDFLWREQRLAVELDSYSTHGAPPRFERDRRRDARLLADVGITVVRVTDRRLDAAPYAVIAQLARLTAPIAAPR